MKLSKKIISFICAILMACISFVPYIGYAKDVTPVIMVPGLGSTALYLNPNTEEETSAMPAFDANTILELNASGLLDNLLNMLCGEDVDFDEVLTELKDFASKFSNLAMDENGKSVANVGVNNYWEDSIKNHPDYTKDAKTNEEAIVKQICDEIGYDNVFILNYDWRQDLCDTADQLDQLIQAVKKETKKKKVTLVSGSLGTSVVSAYLDKYEDKHDVKRNVFLCGAFQGVDITTAYSKDLVFDSDIIMEYADQLAQVPYSAINISAIVDIIKAHDGNIDNAVNFLNSCIKDKKKLNKVFNEVLKPIMGNICSLYECIPYDKFDECVNTVTKIGFLDENSGVYKKIQHYHKVQGRCKKNIKKFIKHGGEVAIVSNYGVPGMPITSAAIGNQTDILIDTKHTSIGATVAKVGKTLNKSGKYVSGDKIIDASTALLPDNTWFIKNLMHMNFNYKSEAAEFVAVLATTNKDLSIQKLKSQGYSQFMEADIDQNIKEVKSADSTTKKDNSQKSPNTGISEYMPLSAIILIMIGGVFIVLSKKYE